MPNYVYENPHTGERVEVIQSINEEHVYVKNGVQWNRIFLVPQVNVDTKWDARNPKDFVEKTGKKKGTIADLWDKSAELSERRREKEGIDVVEQKYIAKERKRRKGKVTPLEVQKARKELGIK